MSFLQYRNPSIRSQLLPVVVDYDAFLDRVMHFLSHLLDGENLTTHQHLEIEIKLGAFLQREQNGCGAQDLLENFKIISQFSHTILNDYAPHYIFQPTFTWPPWSEFFFDGTANPIPFQNLKEYLKALTSPAQEDTAEHQVYRLYVDPNAEGLCSAPEAHLRLDFNFASGDRVSVSYNGTITTETIRKRRIGDLDIMKGEKQYRLTAQIESTTDKCDLDILEERIQNGEQVRQVRFKSTIQIRFQFFRVDISRVHHLTNEAVVPLIGRVPWPTLFIRLLKNLHDVQDTAYKQTNSMPQLRKRDRTLSSQRKCEVEFEVVDLEYLNQNLEPAVRRLLRNVDSFFQIDKVHRELLHHKIIQRFPNASKLAWQPPVLGNYQSTIFDINHSLQQKQISDRL